MKNRTTIQITRESRKLLKKAKRYPRETFDDLIKRLRRERKI